MTAECYVGLLPPEHIFMTLPVPEGMSGHPLFLPLWGPVKSPRDLHIFSLALFFSSAGSNALAALLSGGFWEAEGAVSCR